VHWELEVVDAIAETFSLGLWRVTIYHHLTKREQSERALDRAVNDISLFASFPKYPVFSRFPFVGCYSRRSFKRSAKGTKSQGNSLVAADT